MSSIPVVPGSQMVRTPDAGLKLDAGALNAPNQARMNLGAAVGQVGQVVGDFAQKLQGAVNYGIAADADRKMRQAAAEFQHGLGKRTDESEDGGERWNNEWKEKSDELISSVLDQSNVGPSLKRQLGQNLKDWQQANAIEVKTIANVQKVKRVKTSVMDATLQVAEDGGDKADEMIISLLDGAVQKGAMLPEEAAVVRRQRLAQMDDFTVQRMTIDTPKAAVDALELEGKDKKPELFTNLTTYQRRIRLNQANEALTRYQGGNLDAAKEAVDVGMVMDDAMLKQKLATGEFSQKQVVGYRQYLKTKAGEVKIEELPAASSDVSKMVRAIPKDASPEQREDAIVSIQASPAYNKLSPQLKTTFDGQMKDPNHVLNAPEAKSAFSAIDLQFDSGTYGKFKVVVRTEDGDPGYPQQEFKTITDQKKLAQAIANRTEVEQFTRDLFRNNPGITAVEANKQIAVFQEKFTGPVVDRTVQATVKATPSTPTPTVNITPERQAEMKQWLKANPNSPYAAEVRKYLRPQGNMSAWPDDR